MGQKLQYNPLLNHDIRVIQLLTQADHPDHGTGPVHCKIVHVSLDNAHLVDDGRSATKGSNRVWPVSVNDADDALDGEPETSHPMGFGSLFERSLAERLFPITRIPEVPYLERPNWLKGKTRKMEYQHLAIAWDPSQDPEADLPWRYTWGDFVALSYVWGDQSIRREIYVNDVPVSVTASLESALRELRNHSRIQQGFYIWVDALCINQEDLDERSAQVGRMKDIYHKAWHVVIWLGPEENRSSLAMLALRYMSLHAKQGDVLSKLYKRVEFYVVRLPFMQWKHAHTSLRIRKAVLNAIYHLLARSYWRRLWIIQEVVLGSRKSPVLCGGSSILLKDIFDSLQVMKEDGDALGQYVIFSARGTGQQRWNVMGDDTYEISEKLWDRPVAITALQSLETNLSTPNRGVYDALLLSREANATDQRDHVYGILGLPQIANNIELLPDYNIAATKTFILFSARLLASGDVNSLRLVNSPVPRVGSRYFKSRHFSRPRAPKFIHGHRIVHRGCEHDLPSWVICWSCPRNPVQPFLNRPSTLPLFPSSFPATAPQITNDNLLTVKGILFDTITTLSAFHATESEKSYPHNDPDPPPSPYGSRAETREALARTLLGNDPDVPDPGVVLHPTLWSTGIMGVDDNVFGLKDFYYRNRALRLFDGWPSLDSFIRDPESEARPISRRVHDTASTAPRFLHVTAAHREALAAAMRRLGWRRLVATRSGYLGLVPAATEAGDVVAVLAGCDAPLVLRPVGPEEEEAEGKRGRFSVVGEAYVHWVTGRELHQRLEKGMCAVDDICIR
ncbi:HET-domain-containing protein [Hypoxylon rubiginosum]|uniref:HET-domain-containing protein n=1 Tax=Hypoxylon rubiginosum TaxID=110542 RepID=A0ACB9YN80_9PEZI|nr:HET-domain-containing protein [Hypoxylon rubiginosum]